MSCTCDCRCPVDKPFVCPPYGSCYTFNQFCNTNSRDVHSCFPSSSNALDFCRHFVKGKVKALHPSCQMACQFNFTTEELYPEEFMDTKGVVIVILISLLAVSFVLHIAQFFWLRREQRSVNVKLNETDRLLPEEDGQDGKDKLHAAVEDIKDDRNMETMGKAANGPTPEDVNIERNKPRGEQGRLVEADITRGGETQPGASPTSGTQDGLSVQNILLRSVENLDGNASTYRMDGSLQLSTRTQSFSSASSRGGHRSGATSSTSLSAQASSGQSEHKMESTV